MLSTLHGDTWQNDSASSPTERQRCNTYPSWTVATGTKAKPLLGSLRSMATPKWGGWISITWTSKITWRERPCPTHNQELLLGAQRLDGQKQQRPKQKYRSMKQYGKPRNNLTNLWSPNLWQRRQEYTLYKSIQFLQKEVLGKLDSCMKKNETRALLNTKHKNKLKMD